MAVDDRVRVPVVLKPAPHVKLSLIAPLPPEPLPMRISIGCQPVEEGVQVPHCVPAL